MKQGYGTLELSATDLANHIACRHLTELDRRVALKQLDRPSWKDPALELLKQRGDEHEKAYVAHLRAAGKRVVDLNGSELSRTLEAAREGVDVIVQAALSSERWRGRADILERVERRSALGGWSYDVIDTKLAQETRGGTVLQLCLYADLLENVQGRPAERMAVVKPGALFPREEFRFAEFEAYYRLVKQRLVEFVDSAGRAEPYPEPVSHCDICRWWKRCDERRHRDDDLSLVAGMSGLHAGELRRQRVATLAALAGANPVLGEPPRRGHREAFEKLQAQASVQLRGRVEQKPVSELVAFEAGKGLARLPEPSEGDVYLDFEGDPFVPEGGLEYLLGYVHHEQGKPRYEVLWALDRASEKRALETFVDAMLQRLALHPGFHIHHYAPYEPAALKRLASRHATRERELDVLLRGERFIDLYAVTRQGLRASVESYSLKPLEEFYGYERQVNLREEASPALRRVNCALEAGATHSIAQADIMSVQGYNRDDCLSLVKLRAWLETRRDELVASGAAVERPPLKDGSASEKQEERRAEHQALFERLTAGVPIDARKRSEPEEARWLLAHLIDYFNREERVGWWEYFARRAADEEDLRAERKAIMGLTFVEELPRKKNARTPTHRYRFEPQEVSIEADEKVYDLREDNRTKDADYVGTVENIDPGLGVIDIKKSMVWKHRHSMGVHVKDVVPSDPLPQSLLELARWVADHDMESPSPEHRAARDLLRGRPPRLRSPVSGPLVRMAEELFPAALRCARDLDGGVLALQGPPGSGKTHNGARMILALAREKHRVGVSATSHKVIRNMLEEVLAADEEEAAIEVTHKFSDRSPAPPGLPPRYCAELDKLAALTALDHGHVVGGVAWLWAAQEARSKLDYLFIDEAGQMSLAHVLACARSARNLILLGDPQQLQQPQRGAHPEGAEVSALNHLLGGAHTIAPEQGIFLAETYRLPPPICKFTSELFYDNRLRSRPHRERQKLTGPTPFAGSGLFLIEVEHSGNTSSSVEEVGAVQRSVGALLRPGVGWIDCEGVSHELTPDDLLLIAPYNAQVAALSRAPALERLAIGTVDRFQGQQRPVVLYSLTSSSALDAPRGLSFLYDLHRLNVATSRAQCACILIASPALFDPECRTPEQMRLANGLCRYRELARTVRLA